MTFAFWIALKSDGIMGLTYSTRETYKNQGAFCHFECRVLQMVADNQHIRKEYSQAFPQLLSRLGVRLNWDVAQAVLKLIDQLQGQEVTVVLDAHKLIRCMATAAQVGYVQFIFL
jgi:hypothetical protein